MGTHVTLEGYKVDMRHGRGATVRLFVRVGWGPNSRGT